MEETYDGLISNSYENTEELLKKFPVEHETPAEKPIEKAIQNRLLTGFENWNRGFDAWKAWGNILYTQDSIYNVHGSHMTLAEYQQAMNITLKRTDIQMGAFHNMLLQDDWTAIFYDIATKDNKTGKYIPGSVMEFVKFKDYGGDLGTRVVEGWGGTKDETCKGLSMFLTPQERAAQEKSYEDLAAIVLPDTENLEEKYPVLYPTAIPDDTAAARKAVLLKYIDLYNRGQDDVTIVRIDNMLFSGDWAALHYWTVNARKEVFDKMQFTEFAPGSTKILSASIR